jgi:hypothetical protein
MYLLGDQALPHGAGVEVDELAYPLHRPMAHSCQPRGQGLPARRRPVLFNGGREASRT